MPDEPTEDGVPEQTDNTPRPEDGEQLPSEEAAGTEWTGEEMR